MAGPAKGHQVVRTVVRGVTIDVVHVLDRRDSSVPFTLSAQWFTLHVSCSSLLPCPAIPALGRIRTRRIMEAPALPLYRLCVVFTISTRNSGIRASGYSTWPRNHALSRLANWRISRCIRFWSIWYSGDWPLPVLRNRDNRRLSDNPLAVIDTTGYCASHEGQISAMRILPSRCGISRTALLRNSCSHISQTITPSGREKGILRFWRLLEVDTPPPLREKIIRHHPLYPER
jgi:hypothetical protein